MIFYFILIHRLPFGACSSVSLAFQENIPHFWRHFFSFIFAFTFFYKNSKNQIVLVFFFLMDWKAHTQRSSKLPYTIKKKKNLHAKLDWYYMRTNPVNKILQWKLKIILYICCFAFLNRCLWFAFITW